MPPVAIIVTVAVLPLHDIGVVTVALVRASTAGWVTLMVPATGPQLLTSVILYAWLAPADTPAKTPVVLVTPLNV